MFRFVDGIIGFLNAAILMFGPEIPAEGEAGIFVMTNALHAVMNVVLGVVLLTAAARIVGLIAPDDEGSPVSDRSYSLADLQSVVFGDIGGLSHDHGTGPYRGTRWSRIRPMASGGNGEQPAD